MHLTCHVEALGGEPVKELVCLYCLQRRIPEDKIKTKTCPYCPASDSKSMVVFRCGKCFNFPHVACLKKIVLPAFVNTLRRRCICLQCYQLEVKSGVHFEFDPSAGFNLLPGGTAPTEMMAETSSREASDPHQDDDEKDQAEEEQEEEEEEEEDNKEDQEEDELPAMEYQACDSEPEF